MSKHIFAIYYQYQCVNLGQTLEIIDKNLWHRIIHVLRLTSGEEIILFNGTNEATIKLLEKTFTEKNKVIGYVIETKTSYKITPKITLMPSLLKREAFETVIYLAAQMGATTVQPIITEKTHQTWNKEKEHARITNIMVAACEQAKNFYIPEFKNPIKLTHIKKPIYGIYFEDDGTKLSVVAQKFIASNPQEITLVFGPEGGLTTIERQYLDELEFTCCALTTTILRAQEAVAVGLGAIRSLL